MATLPVAEAREDVAVLFLSYLGRAPEFQAMNYYVGLYNQLLAAEGTNAAAEENAFKALSAQIYVDAGNVGEIPSGPSVSDAEYVDWIYQNVLGRAADEGGRAYWISQLENGSIDRADLVGIVVASAAEDDRDGAYLANRTEVALEFAKFENSNPQIIGSLQFNAKQVLEGVNETEESVAAAEAKLVSATNGGQSFTLTVGVDNLVGTSGNDVFNVVPVNPTNSEGATTLGAFDTIDGGAGRDTLNIFVDGEGKFNTMQVGTIRNIEIINIRNSETGDLFGTADDEVNVAGFQGAEQVWQFTRANDVINLSATAVAGFADIAAENGQDFDVRTAAGVAVANVAFDNVSTEEDTSERDLTIAGAALTGAVITGSLVDADAEDGDDAFLNLTLANTGTNGDVTFTLNTEIDVVIDDLVAVGGAKAKVVGLDASASTGDVEFEFSSADIKTLKGGAGNDSFTFNRALTSSDSVDGGEGTDVVVLAAQGKNLVTQDYNAINALQNIEIVAFQTSNITVDASKLSFDLIGFDLAANGTATVANLAADQTLLVTTQGAAAAGTLVLNTAAVDANVQLDDEDLTLTLTVNARATGVTGGTLTLSGEGEVSYDNTDAKFATIDVSEFNGDFTLTEMAASVVENVVLGADVSAFITLDVAPVGEDDAAVMPSSTFEAMDVITGFKAFADAEDDAAFDLVLGLGNVQTVEIAASVGTLNAAFEQAATAYTGDAADSDVVLFQFEGNTYLYADNNDDGKYGNGDFAIKFVGLYDAADFNVA